jgi:hypothetical protein
MVAELWADSPTTATIPSNLISFELETHCDARVPPRSSFTTKYHLKRELKSIEETVCTLSTYTAILVGPDYDSDKGDAFRRP